MLVFALLNVGDRELRRALEENRQFEIRINGENAAVVGLQELLDLQTQEFVTNMATSAGVSREVTLRGIELRLLLEAFGFDLAGASHLVVSGLDGYLSPLNPAEVLSTESIYICYAMDGEILKTQSEGGYGPFMMVIRGSRFAQRWCKYLEAVDIRT